MRPIAFFLFAMFALGGCEAENDAGRRYRDASDRMVAARRFLDDTARQAGVIQTRSGLLYEVERLGAAGPSSGSAPTRPRPRDEVLVHYRGMLADGEEFESSYDRNTPARFAVGDVIAGWREGLQLMRKGDVFRFYIPPQLGYGARGRPPVIPSNAALIYEVELLDIYPPQQRS